jgi:hypothetical protein
MTNENDEKDIELDVKEAVVEIGGDDIKVEIVDEPAKGGPSIKQGIEELKAQLEEERSARVQAEKSFKSEREKAQKAEAEISQARGEVHDTNIQLLNSAINDIKREQVSYKNAIRTAFENGDFDKATDYQEAMATNVAKLMKIEEGKIAYEGQMKERPAAPVNSVENFASRLSPRSADWVRNNPEYVTDPRLNRKMLAAHQMAVADGMEADTDEYFGYVESMLSVKNKRDKDPHLHADDAEAMSSASAATQRRQAPPAAPVSRQAPSNTTTRPNVVRLNSAEREMAQMMGMTDQEYAKNKVLLIKEGKLPN